MDSQALVRKEKARHDGFLVIVRHYVIEKLFEKGSLVLIKHRPYHINRNRNGPLTKQRRRIPKSVILQMKAMTVAFALYMT